MHKKIIFFIYAVSIFIVGFSGSILIAKNISGMDGKALVASVLTAASEAYTGQEEAITENQNQKTKGLLMFRGNPSRTFYGTGPLSKKLALSWSYPQAAMCADSTVGENTKMWCGSGWTGQPAIWEKADGLTEVIFGAYDKKIHFIDANTGQETRPSFETGDIIKGSVTIDPDGYPLLYAGSRDNKYRIIALDKEVPTELWSLEARVSEGVWNNDWDGNGVVVGDILYEGSENGIFHIIKLNRGYGADGAVIVNPKELMQIKTFSKELMDKAGDRNFSIENSPLIYKNRAYIANSGGRIMGFDISRIEEGIAPLVFDFWAGDDIDATLIADDEGMLYAGIEEERLNERSKEVGQLIKLNPYNTSQPLIWSIAIPNKGPVLGGIWATPAISGKYIYAATNPGELLVIDAAKGKIESRFPLPPHAWSSPAIIDDTLLVGTCGSGIYAYSIEDEGNPHLTQILSLPSGGCIESTPAVWNGELFFGARDGFLYKAK